MAMYSYKDINSVSNKRFSYDLDAIENSIKNILLTKKGEFPGKPMFGSDLTNFLFDNVSLFMKAKVKNEIEISIKNWEPRAIVTGIKVESVPEYHRVNIIIGFTIKKDPTNSEYNLSIRVK